MELKTIKDINWKKKGYKDSLDIMDNDTLRKGKIALYPSSFIELSKQEAIKHIKIWQKERSMINSIESPLNAFKLEGQIYAFIYFFNITEEDLK